MAASSEEEGCLVTRLKQLKKNKQRRKDMRYFTEGQNNRGED